MSPLQELAYNLVPLINLIVEVLGAICLALFMIGIVKYIYSASGNGKESGRSTIVWSVVGLFVLTCLWGIVNLVAATLLGGGGGYYGAGLSYESVTPPAIHRSV